VGETMICRLTGPVCGSEAIGTPNFVFHGAVASRRMAIRDLIAPNQ
jgi:hypothetical protein